MSFDVPNLDGLDISELKDLDTVFRQLSVITDFMLKARAARMSGAIPEALAYERLADKNYSLLPDWAKW